MMWCGPFQEMGREWQISENIRVWTAVPGPFPADFIDLSTGQYRFEAVNIDIYSFCIDTDCSQ